MSASRTLALRPLRSYTLEPVEGRCHFSVTTWTSDTISQLSNEYFGEVQLRYDLATLE